MKKVQEQIGKKEGTYITFSLPTLYVDDKDGFVQLEKTFVTIFR